MKSFRLLFCVTTAITAKVKLIETGWTKIWPRCDERYALNHDLHHLLRLCIYHACVHILVRRLSDRMMLFH